MLELSMLKL